MPITSFEDVTVKDNDGIFDAGWVNDLRTAGINVGKHGGRWIKYSFTYSDFSAAATEATAEILSLDAKGIASAVIVKHSTAFAGTGITAVEASVGPSSDPDKYMTKFDIAQAVADTTFKMGSYDAPENFGSVTSIVIKLYATGANLDQLTAGALDVWVLKRVLP